MKSSVTHLKKKRKQVREHRDLKRNLTKKNFEKNGDEE